MRKLIGILAALLMAGTLGAETRQVLKENIAKAKDGDFVVTCQGKMFTLLHVAENEGKALVIEELAVAGSSIPRNRYSWKQWVEMGAPGNVSWVVYRLNTESGEMEEAFSYTKNAWFSIPEGQNILTTLLNLNFTKIPEEKRKRVGPNSGGSSMRDWRRLWQPPMVVNGKAVTGATFDAWRTRWPNDGSELAGKTIEVYIPDEKNGYSGYFPYWLQVSGAVGKAKIRIIDSGSDLKSPKTRPF